MCLDKIRHSQDDKKPENTETKERINKKPNGDKRTDRQSSCALRNLKGASAATHSKKFSPLLLLLLLLRLFTFSYCIAFSCLLFRLPSFSLPLLALLCLCFSLLGCFFILYFFFFFFFVAVAVAMAVAVAGWPETKTIGELSAVHKVGAAAVIFSQLFSAVGSLQSGEHSGVIS